MYSNSAAFPSVNSVFVACNPRLSELREFQHINYNTKLWKKNLPLSHIHSSNYSHYLRLCWHFSNRCCLLQNDFCSLLYCCCWEKQFETL